MAERFSSQSPINRPISGSIPSSVEQVTFGYRFNQPISPGSIPSSVKQITFGYHFNQSISPGLIPSSVTHLKFDSVWNPPATPGLQPFSLESNHTSILLSPSSADPSSKKYQTKVTQMLFHSVVLLHDHHEVIGRGVRQRSSQNHLIQIMPVDEDF